MSLKSSLKTDVSSPLIEKKDSDFLLPSFGNSLKVKDQITEKKEKKQIESPEFSNSRENNENDIENIISERNYFEQKYIESQNSLKISMEKYENLLFKNQVKLFFHFK